MPTENLLCTTVSSSIGELLLAGDSTGLWHIYFESGDFTPPPNWQAVAALPYPVADQLDSYFAGHLRSFDLPLHPQGTAFQRKVWAALAEIPYGETISYLELARRIGNPNSVRAVGLANGRNPLPIVVPCHRVVGSNGTLVGYAGGLPIKKALLALEGALSPQLDLF
ncbi:MAG: methylated-DNA--[protein]-cysteine S-methyltransferase [Gemmatimonadetes bacterium]|nr:methylated-DNA--[protein]-cysteine S-methyltransferase [Gemmatimonadota bacterium]MYB68702.1 methylated-DNA--[protein]-cysteine S-methyltransferase [Gemmatimonadota bacterium]